MSTIFQFNDRCFAHLANGRVCWWSHTKDIRSMKEPLMMNWPAFSTIFYSTESPNIYGLTRNKSIFLISYSDYQPVEITDQVLHILGINDRSLMVEMQISLEYLYVRSPTRVIALPNSLELIKMLGSSNTTCSGIKSWDLSNQIELMAPIGSRCLIKTVDHRLYSVGQIVSVINDENSYTKNGLIADDSNTPRLLEFPRASEIKDIVPGEMYNLLLLKDGSVYAGYHKYKFNPLFIDVIQSDVFFQIQFPDDAKIIRIFNNEECIYYISTEGLLYYSEFTGETELMDNAEYYYKIKPVRVKALDGQKVTDIYLARFVVIVKIVTEESIEFLSFETSFRGEGRMAHLSPDFLNGNKKPQVLSQFSSKNVQIEKVINTHRYLFFVTNRGGLYKYSAYWTIDELMYVPPTGCPGDCDIHSILKGRRCDRAPGGSGLVVLHSVHDAVKAGTGKKCVFHAYMTSGDDCTIKGKFELQPSPGRIPFFDQNPVRITRRSYLFQ